MSATASNSHSWLFLGLLRRELRDRYAGTAMGLAWVLIHPLLMLGLYSLVFVYIFRIRVPLADGPLAYVAFVAVALWPWFLFQEALLRSMSALRSQATLIRKTALPRDFPVLVAVASGVTVHLSGYLLVLAALTLMGAPIRLAGFPLLVVLILLLLLLVMALGLLLSLAQLIWRDLEQVIQHLLSLLFYATPVLYPLSMVPDAVRSVLRWNPLGWWVERLRDAIFESALPTWSDGAVLIAVVVLLMVVRRAYLRVASQAEDLL